MNFLAAITGFFNYLYCSILVAFEYILKGFGYFGTKDFLSTVFKIFYFKNLKFTIPIIITAGTINDVLKQYIGIDSMCVTAFVLLSIAEFQTGLKASRKKKGERIQSRKIGRMILKIGVYMFILFIIKSFSATTDWQIANFDVNPFAWLYYVVLSWIVLQMLISYFENLSILGYHETRGIKGFVLRKFNRWFEFDGTKDADNFPDSNFNQ